MQKPQFQPSLQTGQVRPDTPLDKLAQLYGKVGIAAVAAALSVGAPARAAGSASQRPAAASNER